MDGLIAESGDDITLTSPHNGYFMKSGYLTDPDLMDIDAYPSVQSWLRPTASSVSRHEKSFKVGYVMKCLFETYEIILSSNNPP
ncbi:unnamed protein product [Trichobilharzia regenti]|nr:unnamed protein product [Trichobilharzia regenti]